MSSVGEAKERLANGVQMGETTWNTLTSVIEGMQELRTLLEEVGTEDAETLQQADAKLEVVEVTAGELQTTLKGAMDLIAEYNESLGG